MPNALDKKYGPFTGKIWLIVVGGGVGLYFIVTKIMGGSRSSSETSEETTVEIVDYGGSDSGSGSSKFTGPYGYTTVGQPFQPGEQSESKALNPPLLINVFANSESSLIVVWSPLSGIDLYKITYIDPTGAEKAVSTESIANAQIMGLKPDTLYEVYVQAIKEGKISEKSNSIRAKTDQSRQSGTIGTPKEDSSGTTPKIPEIIKNPDKGIDLSPIPAPKPVAQKNLYPGVPNNYDMLLICAGSQNRAERIGPVLSKGYPKDSGIGGTLYARNRRGIILVGTGSFWYPDVNSEAGWSAINKKRLLEGIHPLTYSQFAELKEQWNSEYLKWSKGDVKKEFLPSVQWTDQMWSTWLYPYRCTNSTVRRAQR